MKLLVMMPPNPNIFTPSTCASHVLHTSLSHPRISIAPRCHILQSLSLYAR